MFVFKDSNVSVETLQIKDFSQRVTSPHSFPATPRRNYGTATPANEHITAEPLLKSPLIQHHKLVILGAQLANSHHNP